MTSIALPAPAYAAFVAWLIKLRGVPVSQRALVHQGCSAEETPALRRELERIGKDFAKRRNEVSAPINENIRRAYAALGVPWSAWEESASEVRDGLKRQRYARWRGADAADFPDGPPYDELVTVVMFGGIEQVRSHLLHRAQVESGSLHALWCRWLAGEEVHPGAFLEFAGAPEVLREPLYDPGIREVLPLFFVEPDVSRARSALRSVEANGEPRLKALMVLLEKMPPLWQRECSVDEAAARFHHWFSASQPGEVVDLVAPAFLYGQYIEKLPPHRLLERVAEELGRVSVPKYVADVKPIMEVLSALRQLASEGSGLRIARDGEHTIVSAEAPEGGDDFM